MLSQFLHASFADAADQRASDRRLLRLGARAETTAGPNDIQIHNLSRTGMLVEAATHVAIGTEIEVEMPGGARHRADVVWRDTGLFGCRFVKPLSQATLSAALLRAAPALTAAPQADAALLADNAAIARLREHWPFEHETSAGSAREELPLGQRLWTISGLAIASWAIPIAVSAWLLA